MILTKEQIEKRISSSKNIAGSNFKREIEVTEQKEAEVIYKDGKNHFGNPGSKWLSRDEKISIGVLAKTVGKETTSLLMGVSEHTVGKVASGEKTLMDSNGNYYAGKDESLSAAIASRLEKTKLTIEERAATLLLESFNCLTSDKLENSSAREIAGIASSISNVMKNVSSSNGKNNENGSSVRVVIHQPKSVKESSFDCVELSL